MSLSELRSRLGTGLRDHHLYSGEQRPAGRRARLREIERNLAIGLGATSFGGEVVQFRHRGYTIPADLAEMTGAGSESWEAIARSHLDYYERWTPIAPGDSLLEIGCGIGRDAMYLADVLSDQGRYVGLDVTEASIRWCRDNITRRHANFTFAHLDVRSPMYNPSGRATNLDVSFPVRSESVDLIFLHSVFTHMFRDDIGHYLDEFRRVLRSAGKVMASFFIVDDESVEAAAAGNRAQTFRHAFDGADCINDPDHPEAAVAFALESIEKLVADSGLAITEVHRGFWSGLHPDAPNGQDIVVLERA